AERIPQRDLTSAPLVALPGIKAVDLAKGIAATGVETSPADVCHVQTGTIPELLQRQTAQCPRNSVDPCAPERVTGVGINRLAGMHRGKQVTARQTRGFERRLIERRDRRIIRDGRWRSTVLTESRRGCGRLLIGGRWLLRAVILRPARAACEQ